MKHAVQKSSRPHYCEHSQTWDIRDFIVYRRRYRETAQERRVTVMYISCGCVVQVFLKLGDTYLNVAISGLCNFVKWSFLLLLVFP
jgi:hypothetical protein